MVGVFVVGGRGEAILRGMGAASVSPSRKLNVLKPKSEQTAGEKWVSWSLGAERGRELTEDSADNPCEAHEELHERGGALPNG